MEKFTCPVHGAAMAILAACMLLLLWAMPAMTQETRQEEAVEDPEDTALEQEHVQELEDVVVTDKKGAKAIELSPGEVVIDPENFPLIGPPGNLEDTLKTQAIFDFRGQTDLVPDSDTLNMRGFSSSRFVMAVDGLTVQKTGGRKGTHIVDYSLLSAVPLDKIEIIAGPHSARYDSKSIGGVVNLVSQVPKRRDTLKPDISGSASYGSYDTQNHRISVQGAADIFAYGASAQENLTHGYLRNNDTHMETFSGNFGVLLPQEGYASLSMSRSNINREVPVNNTGDDYDNDYPEVSDASFDPWQEPTWDKDAYSFRFNYMQNLAIGRLTAGAYLSKEDRNRAYWDRVDSKDHSQGMELSSMYTKWQQQGGRIEDEYKWTNNHISTLGFEKATLCDGDDKDKRVDKNGTYLQHQWFITPYLDTKLGLRHENVAIYVSNSQTSGIPDRGPWIKREWNQVVPKSYTTWRMDSMAPWLRHTSLSLGVSKIWHAPDSHGEYNPQGRPAGAWLDPEHGTGYDFVLNRRLWGDVSMMLDCSYYVIKDYIGSNSAYAEYTSISGDEDPNLRYSDYKINLEEVRRNGLELNLGGHLLDDLSFYLTYSWQEFRNQGDEPAGRTALDDQAKHRVSAGLQYDLLENTRLMLDYYYQSEETVEESELIDDSDPDDPIYTWRQVDNPAYDTVDFAVEQTLFRDKWFMKDSKLKLYVKNVFDEVYYDARGYPSTDRTFGVVWSFRM